MNEYPPLGGDGKSGDVVGKDTCKEVISSKVGDYSSSACY